MKRFRILISLRAQLIIAFLLLFALLFASFSLLLMRSVEQELNARTEDNLIQYGAFISSLFSRSMMEHMLTGEQRDLIVNNIKRLSLRTDSWVGIVNQKAYILENTGNLRNRWVGDRPEIREALRGENGVRFETSQKGKMIYVATPLFLNGIVEGAIYLYKPLSTNDEFLSSLTQNLIRVGGISLAVALLFVFILASLLTRSLRRITEAVRQMQEGRFHEPIQGLPPNELGLLARAFNEMALAHRNLEKLRSQFVSDVSHELKTPLSSIKALCEVLQEEALGEPEQAAKFLSQMEDEVDRLTRLVTDLLDLSKLQAGFPLRKERVMVEELAAETAEKIPGLKEILSVSSETTVVEGEPDRIRQVFYNLFHNALRALTGVQNPKIAVEIQKGKEMAKISVTDNGVGISPHDLGRIFERFYRTDSSRARKEGGTGLGLAIVKQIVETHGGQVWAESAPGKGSTFFFTLPTIGGAE